MLHLAKQSQKSSHLGGQNLMLHLVQKLHKVLMRVLLARPISPMGAAHGPLDGQGADVGGTRARRAHAV